MLSPRMTHVDTLIQSIDNIPFWWMYYSGQHIFFLMLHFIVIIFLSLLPVMLIVQ